MGENNDSLFDKTLLKNIDEEIPIDQSQKHTCKILTLYNENVGSVGTGKLN